jgi:type VI secretion system protein ImpC
MPFKILALAPFRPQEKGPWPHGPIQVDKTMLDQRIEDLGLTLSLPVPKTLCPPGSVILSIKKLADFHPDGVVENTPFLRSLLEAKKFVAEARTSGLSGKEISRRLQEWTDLPPLDITIADQKPQRSRSSSIDRILDAVALPHEVGSLSGKTQPLTAQIDAVLQQILSHIFSYDDFRNLESSWRGLRLLMRQKGADGALRLEIVPVSHETLEDVLGRLLPEVIQDPPCLVIIDLPFDNSPKSLESLEKIAQFSETLLAPALCWVTHKFLLIDAWQDLKRLAFLPHYLDEAPFAKWRRLRETASARWLAVACNRFLLRYPYGPENKPALIPFEEPHGLWASPVWALGYLIGQSLIKTGWPTRFTEWHRLRVEDLALHATEPDRLLPTETYISEERMHQLIQVGIIPLVASYNKDIAFVPAETTVAGSSLSYQLLITRTIQFLFWCKDNFGQDLEPADIEKGLKEAFSLCWERTGQPGPENVEVSVTKPDPEKPAEVNIVIEPPRQVLPSGEKVELVFNW